MLRVDSVTDPRLPRFLDTFRDSLEYAPGYGGAVDGVPVRTGGRPVTGGSTVDNPPGTAPGAEAASARVPLLHQPRELAHHRLLPDQ